MLAQALYFGAIAGIVCVMFQRARFLRWAVRNSQHLPTYLRKKFLKDYEEFRQEKVVFFCKRCVCAPELCLIPLFNACLFVYVKRVCMYVCLCVRVCVSARRFQVNFAESLAHP